MLAHGLGLQSSIFAKSCEKGWKRKYGNHCRSVGDFGMDVLNDRMNNRCHV